MTQSDFGTIDPNTKSGTALATDLNNFRNALNSCHKGSARPSYAVAGTMWIKDVSSTTWEAYVYDGTDDIIFGTFNPTTNIFTPYIADNSLSPAKLNTSGGTVTGLSADMVDGLHATDFMRLTASGDITWNAGTPVYHRYLGPYAVDAHDGKIGVKLNSKFGLVAYGINTENTGIRYGTLVGNWRIDGPLTTLNSTDDITAGGNVSAGTGKHVYGNALFTTNVANSYIHATDEGDGGSLRRMNFYVNGLFSCFMRSDGLIYSNYYGWLHSYFARYAALGMGDGRVAINCGNPAVLMGYEVYDTGTNTRVRPFYRFDIVNCNCACDCPCA